MRNIIDTFFRECQKMNTGFYLPGYSYCTTDIETICKRYHSKIVSAVQNNFPTERSEKLGFITFKE